MGQCIAMLEQIAVELLAAVKDAKDKDWSKLIPEALEIAKKAYDDYKCFKNNASNLAKAGVDMLLSQGYQKQCILDHLQAAINDVSNIPSEVWHGNWDAIVDDLNNAVDEVQNALAC